MRVAVISAVYNEEKNVARLIESLVAQTRRPDAVFLVDDGSRDGTAEIIRRYAREHPFITSLYQERKGPAAARNKAWRASNVDLCIFTDGDCVPERDWVERLLGAFQTEEVGAACGTYRTLNPEKILARFIGLEIAWRYRNVRGAVDAHGSYNLAIRRRVLEEVGGYNEMYTQPSGEDWDLTYKIARRYKILFIPEAVVGHYHPECPVKYMKNQVRRGYDRMQLYNDHPEKRSRDTYTGPIVKYQVAAAGLSLALGALSPFFALAGAAALGCVAFLVLTSFIPFSYFLARDLPVALFSLLVQFCRYYAWLAGALAGLLRFGFAWGPRRAG